MGRLSRTKSSEWKTGVKYLSRFHLPRILEILVRAKPAFRIAFAHGGKTSSVEADARRYEKRVLYYSLHMSGYNDNGARPARFHEFVPPLC